MRNGFKVPLLWLIYDRAEKRLLHTGVHKDFPAEIYPHLKQALSEYGNPAGDFILCMAGLNRIVGRGDHRLYERITGQPAKNIDKYRDYNRALLKQPEAGETFRFINKIQAKIF